MFGYRKILALTFAALALASGMSLFLAFTNFQANQRNIEKTYCVNKDEADFDCGGQCYFMKKMRAAEETNNPIENHSRISYVFSPLFYEKTEEFSIDLNSYPLCSLDINENLRGKHESSVFHPPKA